jgi:hypothetical protein
VSIESDANQDLALSDEDAEGVVGGRKHAKKSEKAHASTKPLYIDQQATFGTPEVSANSGDDDCAPENGGGSD